MAVHGTFILLALLASPVVALRMQDGVKEAGPALPNVSIDLNNRTQNPFANVLLVIHCRPPPHFVRGTEELCSQRADLYKGYTRHFGKVVYLTGRECAARGNDAYRCPGELLKDNMAYDGLLYMRGDTLIQAKRLRRTFDTEAIATFGEDQECKLKEDWKLKNCSWFNWVPGRIETYKNAMAALKNTSLKTLAKTNRVFLGNDDLYYIPRRFFADFALLASKFAENEVHHGIAGPTIRGMLLEKARDVKRMNLECEETCCYTYRPKVVVRKTFKCGHFNDLKPAFEETKNIILSKFSDGIKGVAHKRPAQVSGFLPDMAVSAQLVDALTA